MRSKRKKIDFDHVRKKAILPLYRHSTPYQYFIPPFITELDDPQHVLRCWYGYYAIAKDNIMINPMNNNNKAMAVMRTVIADDHPIFREGLRCHLAQLSHPAFELVAETENGKQALEACQEYRPDLLILDMNMPVLDGIGVLESLEKKGWGPYTLVLSEYENPKLIRGALDAGADGYLLKSAKLEHFKAAVKTILKGETFLSEGAQLSRSRSRRASKGARERYAALDVFLKKYSLTKRELEILELITQALSNKEIGKTLYISDQTVSVHRKNIMRKLGVSNTAGLIKTAYDHCLV